MVCGGKTCPPKPPLYPRSPGPGCQPHCPLRPRSRSPVCSLELAGACAGRARLLWASCSPSPLGEGPATIKKHKTRTARVTCGKHRDPRICHPSHTGRLVPPGIRPRLLKASHSLCLSRPSLQTLPTPPSLQPPLNAFESEGLPGPPKDPVAGQQGRSQQPGQGVEDAPFSGLVGLVTGIPSARRLVAAREPPSPPPRCCCSLAALWQAAE